MRKNLLSVLVMMTILVSMLGIVSAEPLFSDGFEDGLVKWVSENGAAITSDGTYVNDGSNAVLFDGDGANDRIISANIDTTGYKNIQISYWRMTENFGAGDQFRARYSIDGVPTWNGNVIENVDSTESYSQNVFNFPSSADNNPNLQLKFALNADTGDYAALDDVLVTGDEAIAPEITVLPISPLYPRTTDEVSICADVTDDSSIANVRLTCSASNGAGVVNQPMIYDEGKYCGTANNLNPDDGTTVDCSITATDEYDNSNTETVPQFTFDGLAPTVSANGPYSESEGVDVALHATGSDTVDTSLDYSWDLDNDGVYEISGQDTNFVCLDDSVNTISVKATDDAGFFSTDATTVTCENENPIADAHGPYEVVEGSAVDLTGTATDVDADMPSLIFHWEFSDGTNSDEQNPEFQCSSNGVYTATLNVTDKDSGVGTDVATINCANAIPEIKEFSVVTPINEEETTTLTADVSDAGADDSVLDYEINWGDSSANTFGSTEDGIISATHQYMDDDDYTVTLTVTDSDSASVADTREVVVNNRNPWDVEAGEDKKAAINDVVQFSGSAEDVAADTPTYSWDFGDLTTGTGENPTHIYTARGTYTVTLTVSDEDGGNSTDTLTVTVYDYKIQLNEGWNLFSIPLVPEDDDTTYNSVLDDSIKCDIARVWAYQYDEETGKNKWVYHTVNDDCDWSDGSSSFNNIVPGYGYYIKMREDSMLYKNGERMYGNDEFTMPKPPVITLTPSWNLIGHYGMEKDLSRFSSLATLGERDSTLLDENGHSISTMNPTEGYWIFVTGEGNLDYAPSDTAYP